MIQQKMQHSLQYFILLSNCAGLQEYDVAIVDKLKKWFLTALQEYCSAQLQLHSSAVSGAHGDNDDGVNSTTLDFFTFMDTIEPQKNAAARLLQSRGEIQGLQYLDDSDKTLQSLGPPAKRCPRASHT